MDVLIADDDPVSRRLLQSYLEKWGHNVAAAGDGAQAWRLFESREFPIVISDWMMPEMDGLELIRRIRSSRRPGYSYAILLTARSQKQDIIEGMEAGADDFLSKPFDRDELRVRLHAGQRVVELEAALLTSLQQLGQARSREAEIGGKIQQTLLLGQPPRDFPGASFAALTVSSQEIDGDFYDFYTPAARRVDVVVGDVMGKGVPAALLAAAVKSQFLRALSAQGGSAHDGGPPEPEEIVRSVHREVTAQFIGLEFFATLCYSRFDLTARRVYFVDCGHTKTIHCHGSSGACSMLAGDNMPLGFSEREVYKQCTAPLEPGDVFFFYSDGVTEARNAAGEFFGEERLQELVRANAHLGPEALIAEVRQAVVAFSHSDVFGDDLTCVAVKIEETGTPLLCEEIEISSSLRELAQAREFVREICRRAPGPAVSDDRIAQLELAVTEAASNVMKHAYHGRPGELIQLRAEVFADRFAVLLRHHGEAFDPQKVRAPSFDGSRESGFGVYIIRQSVDEVRYYHDDLGWNCIALVKKRDRDGR